MIGPAAAVLSTVHYQAKIVLTCFGSNCFGNFPKPGANHRINVTRVSCYMRGPDGSTYEWGEVELQDETDTLLNVTLPLDSAGAAGSAPAKQNEGFHWAFSFDVDGAVRLQPKVLVDVPMGCGRDLDAVRHAVRLHATGDVHRIAPDVVDEFVGPYDPGHHVA